MKIELNNYFKIIYFINKYKKINKNKFYNQYMFKDLNIKNYINNTSYPLNKYNYFLFNIFLSIIFILKINLLI